jgi:Pyruvate/2-oxoacid:ferredoxin oxidoreductase delta subunit
VTDEKAVQVLRGWLAVMPHKSCAGCGVCDRKKALVTAIEALEKEAIRA